MLTRDLTRVLEKDNIRVNCICAGPIDTGSTEAFMGYPKTEEAKRAKRAASISRVPLGRTGKPEEIAPAALFLASDEASFVAGVALLVDGGRLA